MDYSNYTREQLLEYIQKLEEQNRSLIEKNESHSNNDVSKDQLISTIENTPNVAIKWFDEDGLVIYWNKASENLYGYTAKETIGKRLSETIHTLEDEVIFNKMLEIIKETGKAYGPYEALIHRRDGSIGWVLATTYPLPINNSKYIFACMYVDITEQKQVQSKLQKNEQILSQSHKLSKMGSWQWDLITNEIVWSDQQYRLFGVEKENFNINLDSYLGFLLPEDKAEIYAKINKALAGDEEYYVEHEIIKGDGSRAFIAETGGVERDSAGKAIAMFGATRDITEQMQILNVLKQKEHNLKETQRIAKIAKWEWNLVNGEILISQEFLSLMNYSTQKQLISYEEFASHLTNEDAERVGNETFAAIEKKLNSFTLEFDFKCDNNIVKRILCHVNAEYNKDGNAVMLYGASQDITDRRAIELEMLSAKEKAEENDRLKTAFLANMSHEIRTPLNGILGFSEILKDNSLTNEERKEYLTTIEKSGNRLLNIINDILDISKIETGQVSLLYKYSDVNDQLKFIYKFFKAEAEAKGIELKLGNPLDESESKIYTDKEKLYAILTNLVKNAIKFTLNGTILIDFEKDNKEYTFKVADTGIGIPKNRQEAIFDRFVQADLENKNAFQGAGLGLSISKAYVELLGGRIWLESEVDKGSTFYFTIPVIDENKSEVNAEKNTTDNMTLTRKIKILIAEDDLVTMKLFERIMSKYASSVLSATDGLTAVELMKANPDIDLIIMDIRMPIMDGYTATEEIRKFNNKVIIIGQSAHVFESNKDLSLKNGCNEYLSKPINIKELNEIIYKYFG